MYGWAGAAYSTLARRHLAQLAEVHHGDPIADVLDDGQVVGDEQQRQTVAGLEILEQVEHLGLHADVERRHRLVADHQARIEDERAGDGDALALSAGELVRPALGGPGRVDADLVEEPVDDGPLLGVVAATPDRQRLADGVAQRCAAG